jgi:hypothetical protein
MGGGLLGEIANDFISSELPYLVETNKGPILLDLAETVKGIANEKLVGLTIDDLLNLINGAKKSINVINRTSEIIRRKINAFNFNQHLL